MDFKFDNTGYSKAITATDTNESARKFMLTVYNWMTLGLGLTSIIAFGIARSELVMIIMQNPMIFWGLIIVQFLIVMGLSFLLNKINSFIAVLLFFAYAAITGVTFSTLFLVYTESSIFLTFFICAAMFGVVSVFGYVTKMDLTKMGSFLFMGLIGLIIASVINIFIGSSTIYWITSFAGVIIFTGLTAWDTQKIKNTGMFIESGSETGKKASIFGALMLYLDFINLFLFLLRFTGGSRD